MGFFVIEVSQSELRKQFGDLTFASLNVNSLNLSDTQSNYKYTKTDEKLTYIFSKKSSVIFLQDIRLGNGIGTFLKKIKCTPNGNYTAFTNSDKDARGVAILINNSIDFKVHSEYKDPDQNVIIIDITLKNIRCSLVSAYGPKQYDNPTFLTEIKTKLITLQNPIYFVMGDLNCIPTLDPPGTDNSNIDLKNQLAIPNPTHSRILNKMIEEGFFIDSFRSLNPSLHTFSYIPFGNIKKNRARLDHALVSSDIFSNINCVSYLPNPRTLFDHKLIKLSFRKHKFSPPTIDNQNLDEYSVMQIAETEAWNTLADYANFQLDQNFLMEIRVKRMEISSIAILMAKNNEDRFLPILAGNLVNQFKTLTSLLPEFDEVLSNGITISHATFLQTLINNMSNSITQAQISIKRAKTLKLSTLYNNLRLATDSELQDSLHDKISNIENAELLKSCQKLKLWEVIHLEKPSKSFSRLAKNAKNSVSLDCIELHENNVQTPFQTKELQIIIL